MRHFAALPARALVDQRLTGLSLRVLGVVALYDCRGAGCQESQRKLATELGCNFSNLSTAIADLVRWNYIRRDASHRRILRVIYSDNQSPEVMPIGITAAEDVMPTGITSYAPGRSALCPADSQTFEMTNELFPQREREKERKTLTSEKSKPKPATCQAVIDAAFEEFKRAYPKRDGGQGWPTVRKHLEAAWKSGEDLEAIVRAAAKFCASLRRDTIGTKYVPMAETWMRKRNWAEFAAEPMQSAMSEFPALPGSSEFESWYAYCCANPHIGSVRELKRQLDRRREEGRAFNFPARWPPPELRLVGAAG